MNDTRIHRILAEHGAVAFPGVYDTLSARICQRVGFPMTFISGYSVAATSIGEPDLGLLTQTEMIDRAWRISMSVQIPVIVDADTGYGNPLNVYRTVQELILAGAAGCFLEDQVWPKRCGHLQGKRIVERDEYVQKTRAAAEARGGRDFFIVARTDALAVVGLDEAVARVTAAREAGADASFVEAPGNVEELAEIGRRAPAPNVANMLEGGKTPILPWQSRGFPTGLEDGQVEQVQQLLMDRGLSPLCNPIGVPSTAKQYVPILRYRQSRGYPVCVLPQGWLQAEFVPDRRGRLRSAHQAPAQQSDQFPCPALLQDPRKLQ